MHFCFNCFRVKKEVYFSKETKSNNITVIPVYQNIVQLEYNFNICYLIQYMLCNMSIRKIVEKALFLNPEENKVIFLPLKKTLQEYVKTQIF
jgi:hypothetical protein